MRTSATVGRAEAFRRAMLALMSDDKRPGAAHPSAWAPFVVVGEGAGGSDQASLTALPPATSKSIGAPAAKAKSKGEGDWKKHVFDPQ